MARRDLETHRYPPAGSLKRSMSAVAVAALGKIVGHSLKGRLAVRTRLRRSYETLGARGAWGPQGLPHAPLTPLQSTGKDFFGAGGINFPRRLGAVSAEPFH